jgi:hypothetical protein
MFIKQFRWIRWERIGRQVRCVGWNNQLGRSVGNGRIFCIRRKHRHGRKRFGRPVLDRRCYRIGRSDGNRRKDVVAIGRVERLRRRGWGRRDRW